MNRHSRFAIVVFALLASASASFAGGVGKTHADYFFGFKAELEPEDIAELRANLESAEAECSTIGEPCVANEVLLTLFGDTFRQKLPDVLLYVRRQEDGTLQTHRPLLLWKGENTPYVFGARHLYVLVVSDEKLSLNASLTTIAQRSTNPLAGILTLLKFAPAEPAAKEAKSNRAPIFWLPLGSGSDGPYLGWARLDIEADSVNRLTIAPRYETVKRKVTENEKDDDKPKYELERVAEGPEPLPGEGGEIPFREVTAHLSNSRATHAGFGVALGTTFDVEDTALQEGGSDLHHNAYALAKLYLLRPRLKVGPDPKSQYRFSVGLVFGTNVANDPFEELIGGISIGHLIGKLGLTVGVNFVRPKDGMDEMAGAGESDGGNERKLFVGVDYSF